MTIYTYLYFRVSIILPSTVFYLKQQKNTRSLIPLSEPNFPGARAAVATFMLLFSPTTTPRHWARYIADFRCGEERRDISMTVYLHFICFISPRKRFMDRKCSNTTLLLIPYCSLSYLRRMLIEGNNIPFVWQTVVFYG